MRIALACLLLLAPGKTYELKYKFKKGMSYVDVQKRVFDLTVTESGRRLVWNKVDNIHIRRTILAVDETHHPKAERVQVITYSHEVKASPEDKEIGITKRPGQGKSFVWRRLRNRWGLFDDSGEVTKDYRILVEHLKNWRDGRLPKDPIAVGKAWEISSKKFLQTAGQRVPEGVEGVALFRLKSVERGIATIPFEVGYRFKNGRGNLLTVNLKGVWVFDTARGRDLSFAVKGTLEIDDGKNATGTLVMSRTVTYSK